MEQYYQERARTFGEKYERVRKKYNYNSLLRGAVFIALIWVLIFYFRTENFYLILLTIAIGFGFYLLVLRHQKLRSLAQYYSTLRSLNKEEVKRIHLDLSDFENGSHYQDEEHPYQADLDIFGNASLYQLVNRCQIDGSKDMLADWLSAKSSSERILDRQEAVKELSNDIDWGQDLTAQCQIAIQSKQKNQPSVSNRDLINWINRPTSFSKPGPWKWLAIISNSVLLVLIALVIAGNLPYQILYVSLVINAIFLGLAVRYMNDLIQGIDKSYYIISTYQKAMKLIETKPFSSKKLLELQEHLNRKNGSATRSIKKLARITHRLSSRSNMLYIMADVAFLLDVYLLVDLHNWKSKNKATIAEWLSIVNEVECLISLSGFSHTNPNFTFPEITERSFYFQAENLGHPLIRKNNKVSNDYTIDGKGSVDIITGSNMSGKSTFQRTIGINMVLAQMGAPVDARRLTMGLTDIFTSMRTKDNLAENTSSFYAELKRIKHLLDDLEKNRVTFFLLDEILKGTNSDDRQKGAISLARKLTNRPAFGLISTHDLTLGKLAEEEKLIRNFSFNSEINGNEITFDYKLTEGVCRSFNATKLMENMGIM